MAKKKQQLNPNDWVKTLIRLRKYQRDYLQERAGGLNKKTNEQIRDLIDAQMRKEGYDV